MLEAGSFGRAMKDVAEVLSITSIGHRQPLRNYT